ncbi:hypothetical protein LCGC14_0893880, partial [marine sediment metagenome]
LQASAAKQRDEAKAIYAMGDSVSPEQAADAVKKFEGAKTDIERAGVLQGLIDMEDIEKDTSPPAKPDQPVPGHGGVAQDLDAAAKALEESGESGQKAGVVEGSDSPGFKNVGQLCQAARIFELTKGASTDPRLVMEMPDGTKAPAGQGTLIGEDGGFLVGDDITTSLLSKGFEQAQLASRCTQIEIGPNSNAYVAKTITETSRATGSRYGGIRMHRVEEGGTLTPSTVKLEKQRIELSKIAGLLYATEEQIADDVQLTSFINVHFPLETAHVVDTEIFRGTGVSGQCQGVLNANALVTITAEAGQDAATIIAENVENMWASIWTLGIAGYIWTFNQFAWPQLFQMAHNVGTGGLPVYLPPSGLSGAPFGTLFGLPVVPIEQASAVGTIGDITLSNFSQYNLIRKGGVKADTSMHVRFLTDEMAFRWTFRVNGQSSWTNSVTPESADSGKAFSPFIALATRA